MRHRHAFTLVELAIVLVILGLLVGGILTGQMLIRAAQNRAIIVEYDRFTTAKNAFKDKYFQLPGDFSNATGIWGIAGGTTGNDATCAAAASTDAKTCNGNGDNILLASTGSYEPGRYWQHLANAGLISGQFNGLAGTVPGTNVPGSKFSPDAYWGVWNRPTAFSGDANAFDGPPVWNNYITIASTTGHGVMSPSDAWNVDVKMDDGMPATGKIMSNWGAALSATSTACTTAASSATLTAHYALTNENKDCVLWFNNI